MVPHSYRPRGPHEGITKLDNYYTGERIVHVAIIFVKQGEETKIKEN